MNDEDREACYVCEIGSIDEAGCCSHCGVSVDSPASKWARAVADDDPDGFQQGGSR